MQPGGAAYMAAMAACARGGVVDLALELLDKVLVEHPDDKMVGYDLTYSGVVHCRVADARYHAADCGQ